jgi:error-prone DNA polymerase
LATKTLPSNNLSTRDCGMALIHGSEFAWGPLRVVALARDLNGWGNLCEFISAARSRADKGQYLVDADSPWQLLREGCECIIVPQRAQLPAGDVAAMAQAVQEALAQLGSHCWLGVELLLAPDDSLWLQSLQDVAGRMGLSCVACGDVHMHARSRKPLQDLVTALRLGCTVAECGFELHPNAERHLRSRLRLGGIYPRAMLDATVQIAARCPPCWPRWRPAPSGPGPWPSWRWHSGRPCWRPRSCAPGRRPGPRRRPNRCCRP